MGKPGCQGFDPWTTTLWPVRLRSRPMISLNFLVLSRKQSNSNSLCGVFGPWLIRHNFPLESRNFWAFQTKDQLVNHTTRTQLWAKLAWKRDNPGKQTKVEMYLETILLLRLFIFSHCFRHLILNSPCLPMGWERTIHHPNQMSFNCLRQTCLWVNMWGFLKSCGIPSRSMRFNTTRHDHPWLDDHNGYPHGASRCCISAPCAACGYPHADSALCSEAVAGGQAPCLHCLHCDTGDAMVKLQSSHGPIKGDHPPIFIGLSLEGIHIHVWPWHICFAELHDYAYVQTCSFKNYFSSLNRFQTYHRCIDFSLLKPEGRWE